MSVRSILRAIFHPRCATMSFAFCNECMFHIDSENVDWQEDVAHLSIFLLGRQHVVNNRMKNYFPTEEMYSCLHRTSQAALCLNRRMRFVEILDHSLFYMNRLFFFYPPSQGIRSKHVMPLSNK